MKLKYAVTNDDSAVGFIYEHEKFGKVIILDKNEISLDDVLSLHYLGNNKEAFERDKVDVLKIVLDHLGMAEEQTE